ncbi:putative phloem protein [Medicago truncatula]|uniref:F-box protein PP2-A13 n=1 Tax=Medicago truncatula TaxID=3880 RepID=A0A072UXI4_MEDTR|nr:putative F-box protein PP2-B12 [Medicago truncatula]KEH33773.1 F-box protein PP2-A13 [Medicago truncatula]RHN66933.1 putative phloem protein [Medicago truncatula]
MIKNKRIRLLEELPEGCIATILSCRTPVDACRLSILSKSFRSAADSDTVWDRFLTSDSIILQSPSLANTFTKKDLYMALSDRPIIIDQGTKSFQLQRKSGQKCYLLAARSLTIDCRNVDGEKEWIPMHDSRFPEVAKLSLVFSHEIRGIIKTLSLSPNTQYAAYLVFKIIDACGSKNEPVNFSVGVSGGNRSIKSVCLDPNLEHRTHNNEAGLQRPSVRCDGWLEIEMGEFFNSSLKDEEIHMSVIQRSGTWVRGNLFIEGIEVRPKYGN